MDRPPLAVTWQNDCETHWQPSGTRVQWNCNSSGIRQTAAKQRYGIHKLVLQVAQELYASLASAD